MFSDQRKVVLCIDDDECVLDCLKLFLGDNGHSVLTASSGVAGLVLLGLHSVDVVILDYHMPEMNGHRVAVEIRRLEPRTPIIMYTGEADLPTQTLKLVDAFIQKNGLSGFSAIAKFVASLPARISPELPRHTTALARRNPT